MSIINYHIVYILSDSTAMRRFEDMGDNVRKQLQTIGDKFEYFSTALDESCDVGDTGAWS